MKGKWILEIFLYRHFLVVLLISDLGETTVSH